MSSLSFSEENYLKAIYHAQEESGKAVTTNDIAATMNNKAASVTEMFKRLHAKDMINYEKYHGATTTESGKSTALQVIRKHRLWEVFLVNKLKFNWNEVHEVAEQLEHIHSPVLINRLDDYLGNPKYDPHGDPIPDENGKMGFRPDTTLNQMDVEDSCEVICAKDTSTDFLNFLDKIKVHLGAKIKVLDKNAYDNSMVLEVNGKDTVTVSEKASKNLYVINHE